MAASSNLTAPRKKKRIHQEESSPFPVPIQSIDGKPVSTDHWYYYTGYLVDNCVVVTEPGDITFLYKRGFFGKGILSRSKPEHKRFVSSYQGTVRKNLPPKERRFQQQRFQQFRKRRYMRHLEWYNEYLRERSTSCHSDSDADPPSNGDDGPIAKKKKIIDNTVNDDAHTVYDDVTARTDDVITKRDSLNMIVTEGYTDVILRNDDVIAVKKCNKDDIHPAIICPEIENMDNKKPENTKQIHLECISNLKKVDRKDDRNVKNAENKLTNSSSKNEAKKDDTCGDSSLSDDVRSKCSDNDDVMLCTQNDVTLDTFKSGGFIEQSESDHDRTEQLDVGKNSTQHDSTLNEKTDVIKESATIDDNGSDTTDVVMDFSDGESESFAIETKRTEEKTMQDGSPCTSKHGKMRKVVRKQDPYPVFEYLQLSLEEAFFLSYGLGCLMVLDEHQHSLNLSEMWLRYCAINSKFVASYTVYHTLRSKGWVPKTGIKFGSDFIVYKQGPPFYHSTYSVLVSMVDEETLLPCQDEHRPLSWPVMCGMNRVTEHAAKEIMFCNVLKPTEMTDIEMKSPRCLQRLKVQEIVMRRWVSSKERTEKDYYSVIS